MQHPANYYSPCGDVLAVALSCRHPPHKTITSHNIPILFIRYEFCDIFVRDISTFLLIFHKYRQHRLQLCVTFTDAMVYIDMASVKGVCCTKNEVQFGSIRFFSPPCSFFKLPQSPTTSQLECSLLSRSFLLCPTLLSKTPNLPRISPNSESNAPSTTTKARLDIFCQLVFFFISHQALPTGRPPHKLRNVYKMVAKY